MADESRERATAKDLKTSGGSGSTIVDRSSGSNSACLDPSSSEDRRFSTSSRSPTQLAQSPSRHGEERDIKDLNSGSIDRDLSFQDGQADGENGKDSSAVSGADLSGEGLNPHFSQSSGAGPEENDAGQRMADGTRLALIVPDDQPTPQQAKAPSWQPRRQPAAGPSGLRSRSPQRRSLGRQRNGSRSGDPGQGYSRSRSPIQRRDPNPTRREPPGGLGKGGGGGGRVRRSFPTGPGAGSGWLSMPSAREGPGMRGGGRPASPPPPLREQTEQWTYEHHHAERRMSARGPPEPGPGLQFGPGHPVGSSVPRGPGPLPYEDRLNGPGFHSLESPTTGRRAWSAGSRAPFGLRPRSPSPPRGPGYPGDYPADHQRHQLLHRGNSHVPGSGAGRGRGRDSGNGLSYPRFDDGPRGPPPPHVRGSSSLRGGGQPPGFLPEQPSPPPLPLRRGPSPPPPLLPPSRVRPDMDLRAWEDNKGYGHRVDPGTGYGREPRSPGAIMPYREQGQSMGSRGWDHPGPAPIAGHNDHLSHDHHRLHHHRDEDRRGPPRGAPSGPPPASDPGPRWHPPHLAGRRVDTPRPQLGPRPQDRMHAYPSPALHGGGQMNGSSGVNRGGLIQPGRYGRGPSSSSPPPLPSLQRRHSAGGEPGPLGMHPNRDPDDTRHAQHGPPPRGGGCDSVGRMAGPEAASGRPWAPGGRRSPSPPPHFRHYAGGDAPRASYETGGAFRRPASPPRPAVRSPYSAHGRPPPFSEGERRSSPSAPDHGPIGGRPGRLHGAQSDRLAVGEGRGGWPGGRSPPRSPPSSRGRPAPPPLPHWSGYPRDGPPPAQHYLPRSPAHRFPDRSPIREYPSQPPPPPLPPQQPSAAPRFTSLASRDRFDHRAPAGGDGYGNRRPLSPRSADSALPPAKRRVPVDLSGRGPGSRHGLPTGFGTGRGGPQPGSPSRPSHHRSPGHTGSFRGASDPRPSGHYGGGTGGRAQGNSRDILVHSGSGGTVKSHDPNDRGAVQASRTGRMSEVNAGAAAGLRGGADSNSGYIADGGRRAGAAAAAAAAGSIGGGGAGGGGLPPVAAGPGGGVGAGRGEPTPMVLSVNAASGSTGVYLNGGEDESSLVWFYIDPAGHKQGPCSLQQFRSWLRYLGADSKMTEEYDKFRTCVVWRELPPAAAPEQQVGNGVPLTAARRTTLSELLLHPMRR